ncbi:hypothetical protein QVD17_41732 [Tagetes erecta]|uniref:Uncharacterized protein n=1 Tax=Tagetes erecta TaxID=13708 RepID=A0AAD8JL59_TARER|nr:hypothetical protein QVD17_41732 [Tagetes erecta]
MARSSTGGGRGRGRGNGHDSYNTCRIGRGNGHDSFNIGIIGRGNGHDNFNTGTIGRGNGCDSSNTCTIGRGNGHENYNTNTIGRSHSDAYESLSQSDSSDDDDLTVGRRGPVAPTPLPEPRNREWIWITHNQFSNQQNATRTIGEILHAMWSHPWTSRKEVSKEDGDRMFERFNGYYQWEIEVWVQSHGKKGTRPLDRLLRHGEGEGSQEYESLEEIDLQNNIEWVDTKSEESFRLYKEYVKEKYGNDTSKRPLFDFDTWVGGKKNGRFNIRDPHVMKMGTSPILGASNSCSTTTNEEVQQMKEKIVQLQEEKKQKTREGKGKS